MLKKIVKKFFFIKVFIKKNCFDNFASDKISLLNQFLFQTKKKKFPVFIHKQKYLKITMLIFIQRKKIFFQSEKQRENFFDVKTNCFLQKSLYFKH